MIKRISFLVSLYMICAAGKVNAQDTTINLNLLKAPSSPGANLLGFAASDIEKPSDVSAFMVSLQTATGSFSKLPSSYAVDLAPYWLFSKKTDFTTAGLAKTDFKNVFKQTLVVSMAVRNPDSTMSGYNSSSTYGALGFKFSLLRPGYDTATVSSLNKIWAIQYDINHKRIQTLNKWLANEPAYMMLVARRKNMLDTAANKVAVMETTPYLQLSDSINALVDNFNNEDFKQYDVKALKEQAAAFNLVRQGWSVDFAGGISAEFANRRFDSSLVHNAGVWSTFGYTGKSGSSLLGIVRYLYNPAQVFAKDNAVNTEANISTLDMGLRYVYAATDARFNVSAEALYRSVLTGSTIDPSWRFMMNAEYAIWKNQKLTFSFGRNFDGTVTKDGNLVAALTFLTGLGNKR